MRPLNLMVNRIFNSHNQWAKKEFELCDVEIIYSMLENHNPNNSWQQPAQAFYLYKKMSSNFTKLAIKR